jgi:DNA repair protein RadA/Sms
LLYISGEEASAQVRMRAQRLGLTDAPVRLGAETNLRDILTTMDAERPGAGGHRLGPDHVAGYRGQRAGVGRAGARGGHELVTFAKRRGVSVVLVGHVTKEGQIAGPRVVEHMVDTVLYFEGERGHQFRILRAVKNRFGPADEIGVFEMTGAGLAEVANPSALFLAERDRPAPDRWSLPGSRARGRAGGVPGAGRPCPAGVRAPLGGGLGRRPAGDDPRGAGGALRHPLRRAGCLSERRRRAAVGEPAADLAVAAALLSAREDVALPPDTVVFGEISLSGALGPWVRRKTG